VREEYKNELKKVVGFNWLSEPQKDKITEREVLEKIANAKRLPAREPRTDIVRIYGTMGGAVVYPPNNLELPNLIIQATHSNNHLFI
jgi:hypothetical protein